MTGFNSALDRGCMSSVDTYRVLSWSLKDPNLGGGLMSPTDADCYRVFDRCEMDDGHC